MNRNALILQKITSRRGKRKKVQQGKILTYIGIKREDKLEAAYGSCENARNCKPTLIASIGNHFDDVVLGMKDG